jgi:hypothetical protein
MDRVVRVKTMEPFLLGFGYDVERRAHEIGKT